MSVVYGAYDPKLDRRVALKLVRPGGDGRDCEHVRDRLIREAQALARLAHPNVVTVHDVGTLGDQVFVAMEYVEGRTLTEWLTQPRSTAELLDVFVHAGEGLAAAHAVGLVHRDFKPDNVMIGEGRVRVVDFGLARPSGSPSSDVLAVEPAGVGLTVVSGDALEGSHRQGSEAFEVPLTVTGAVMGTPAYMAPEQHRGGRTGPATDQFSFCVALYEALYGEPPFGGDNRAALRANVLQGRMRSTPRSARVPRRLRQALVRGLAVQPRDRWPSMSALLDELRQAPRQRRRMRRRIGGVLVVAALAGVIGGPRLMSEGESVGCTVLEPLARTWRDPAPDSLGERLGPQAPSWARTVGARVLTDVEALADDWSQARAQACAQELAAYDPRVRCLERWRSELAAILTEAVREDGLGLERAVEQLAGASSPHACVVAEPAIHGRAESGGQSTGVAPGLALRRALTELHTLMARHELDDVLARTAELQLDAEALGDGTLRTEVWLLRGQALARAERLTEAWLVLEQAFRRSVAEEHDGTAIAAAIEQVQVLARLGRVDAALDRARDAEAFIGRRERGSLVRARLKIAEAAAHAALGRYDYARGLLFDAWERRRAVLGEDAPGVAHVRVEQGALEQAAGRLDLALDHYRLALAQLRQSLGDEHPQVATLERRVAGVLAERGAQPAVREAFERALQRTRRAHAPSHPAVARALLDAGDYLARLGASEQALGFYDEALQIVDRVLGQTAALGGRIEHHRARVWLHQGHLDDAERGLERALARLDDSLGSGHAWVAAVLDDLGRVRRRQGALAGSLEVHRRAEAIWRRDGGDRGALARSLVYQAHVLLHSGHEARALARLEGALEWIAEHSSSPQLEAEARFLRAWALVEVGEERAEAVGEARAAATLLSSTGHADPAFVEDVDRWIARHG